MKNPRLEKQIRFIIEADKIKQVLRQNYIIDNSRRENDAEHSWHLALMAMILSEHSAKSQLDIFKVLKMVVIRDLVEIDAGDTFAYDKIKYVDKRNREEKAAQRIFGLLPEDQRDEMIQLWQEFEYLESEETRFAASLYRLQPLINNYKTEAAGWKNHTITKKDLEKRNQLTKKSAPELWKFIQEIIEEISKKGYLGKEISKEISGNEKGFCYL